MNAGSATFQPVKMLGIPLPTALTPATPGTVPEVGLEVDPYGLQLLSFRFSQGEALAGDQGTGRE